MVKTRKAFLRLALGATAAVVALGTMTGCSGDSAQQSAQQTVDLHASWAVTYKSLGELKTHADLAVLGRFTKVISSTHDSKGVPFTDFAFRVDSVVNNPRGRQVAAGSTLTIHQTGGQFDNVLFQIPEDPLFKVNENAALFLVEYKPGMYRVVGGPTGRFKVTGGRIAPATREGLAYSGSSDSFTATVRGS